MPRRINEIYATERELNERGAFDRRRGFIFIGARDEYFVSIYPSTIIFFSFQISLVSSQFSYIYTSSYFPLLSFYLIEIFLSAIQREIIYFPISPLSRTTLTRREDGEGKFLSRLRLRDQNNRYLFSVTYPKHGYESKTR